MMEEKQNKEKKNQNNQSQEDITRSTNSDNISLEDFEEVGEEDFNNENNDNNTNDGFDARDITEMVSEGFAEFIPDGKKQKFKNMYVAVTTPVLNSLDLSDFMSSTDLSNIHPFLKIVITLVTLGLPGIVAIYFFNKEEEGEIDDTKN